MAGMYRNTKAESDDSDDEPHAPVTADDDDDDYEPKVKRETVWTDVAVDQSLNAKSKNISIEKVPKFQRVSRGAESYEVPAEQLTARTEPIIKQDVPVVTVTPASDDPFGDPVDLSAVEGFGVASSANPRGRGRGSFTRGRGRGGCRPPQKSSQDEDVVMEEGAKADGEASDADKRKDTGGWMRGRGRGHYWQQNNRGGFRGRGGPQGFKRNWQGNGVDDPKKILAPEYSLEALLAVEFTQGLPLTQLGQEIGSALGEKDPATIIRIVEVVGEEKALQLFEETREIETKGGMKINDGSRRRTPGGVYISLLKTDVDVTPELKDKIFEANKQEQRRHFKQAKRRNFEAKMKEVSELIEKEKAKEEAGLKALPEMCEVVSPDVSTTVTDAMES